jgi:hypothetical protein
MAQLQDIKEEIERVNLEVQQAERDYDLNRCVLRSAVPDLSHISAHSHVVVRVCTCVHV